MLAAPAASEQNGNPYVDLLYDRLRARGWVVERLTRRSLLTRPDALHVHWPEQLVRTESPRKTLTDGIRMLAGIALARRRGAVLAWTAHNLQPHDRRRPWLMRAFVEGFTRQVDVVITLTEGSEPLLRARYRGLRDTPFVVVPHGHYRDVYRLDGLDRDAARRRLGLDPEARTLLMLGQIRRYKNAAELVRAFVAQAGAPAQLAVVGGVASDELRAELEQARAGDERVRLRLAAVTPDEVAAWHAAADVVVLPYDVSSSLNSGAALLALSLDTPVVMPDGPSARELGAQVGEGWVTPVGGAVPAFVAAASAASPPASPRPRLEHLDWDGLADRTLAAYGSGSTQADSEDLVT